MLSFIEDMGGILPNRLLSAIQTEIAAGAKLAPVERSSPTLKKILVVQGYSCRLPKVKLDNKIQFHSTRNTVHKDRIIAFSFYEDELTIEASNLSMANIACKVSD